METPSYKENCIPIGLLKKFQNDLRYFPPQQPSTGWIMFDSAMLAEVLMHGTDKERMDLASHLTEFNKAGGSLVMMQEQKQKIIQ